MTGEKCPLCDAEFRATGAVRDHAWDAHGACHYCGETFDDEETLYIHWLANHEGELGRVDQKRAETEVGDLTMGDRLTHQGPRSAVTGLSRRSLLVACGTVFAGSAASVSGLFNSKKSSSSDSTTQRSSVGISTNELGDVGGIHWHADFSVTINGDSVDFAKDEYMVQSRYVHLEGGDGSKIHKHATGVTLAYFFKTIGWRLTNECLTTDTGTSYCTGDGGKLRIIVNGKDSDNPQYKIQDEDTIKVIFE